jgi:hypothetical protein
MGFPAGAWRAPTSHALSIEQLWDAMGVRLDGFQPERSTVPLMNAKTSS